jgi:hypothetical protein
MQKHPWASWHSFSSMMLVSLTTAPLCNFLGVTLYPRAPYHCRTKSDSKLSRRVVILEQDQCLAHSTNEDLTLRDALAIFASDVYDNSPRTRCDARKPTARCKMRATTVSRTSLLAVSPGVQDGGEWWGKSRWRKWRQRPCHPRVDMRKITFWWSIGNPTYHILSYCRLTRGAHNI